MKNFNVKIFIVNFFISALILLVAFKIIGAAHMFFYINEVDDLEKYLAFESKYKLKLLSWIVIGSGAFFFAMYKRP
jgi:hypothetical protein